MWIVIAEQLISLLALKAKGVSKVIVVDVVRKRLDKALELGADAVIPMEA